MAILQFDARTVAPDPGRGDPIPAGWYNVIMEKSETKPTSAGDGTYLETVFNVIEGASAGRKLFHRFNTGNNNAQAKEIAYKQLSAVCHAVQVLTVNDSAELHNRPLKVKVKIRPAEGQYDAQNEITAFKNVNEQVGPATPVAAIGGMPPPTAAAWAPPVAPQPQAQPAQWAPPAAAPAGPPPGWQPPAQPQVQPQAAPAQWQPPPAVAPQPWAQAPAPVQAPAAPQQWAPPAAAPQPQTGAPVPPWMTQVPPQG